MLIKQAAESYTIFGQIIGVSGQGEGTVMRPDRQSPEEAASVMESGPYIVAADRVLEEHDWCLHSPNLRGIIAEAGGAQSHGAVVAREQNIPCVVNAKDVSRVQPGDQVFVDADSGEIRVNGGGEGGLTPEGEGDPLYNFVFFNYSFMIGDAGSENHQQQMQYMESFGLWGPGATIGTVYDNGYAQVDNEPPGDEFEYLRQKLISQYGALQSIGTEPPSRGKFEAPAGSGVPTGTGPSGYGPGKMAAADVARFLWVGGNTEWSPVDPADPNKEGTTHNSMADKMLAEGTYDWMAAMDGNAVAGIIYDDGHADILLDPTLGGELPSGYPEMESWVRQNFPEVTNLNPIFGGLNSVLKMGAEDKKDSNQVRLGDPVICDNCGGHTIRAYNVNESEGKAKFVCLTCNNEWEQAIYKSANADYYAYTMAQVVLLAMERGEDPSSYLPMNQHQYGSEQVSRIVDDALARANGDPYNARLLLQDEKGGQRLPEDTRTAATLEKGQRVQVEHKNFSGARGTILEHVRTDDDFSEEIYKILLDSGEELEEVRESDFKKIKSAAVDPEFVLTLDDEVVARAHPLPEDVLTGIDGGHLGEGYTGHPCMCYMCGNERSANLGERCATCGYVLSIRRDGPPKNDRPFWKSSTVVDSDFYPRTFYLTQETAAGVMTHHLVEEGELITRCGKEVHGLQRLSGVKWNQPCVSCFIVGAAIQRTADVEVGKWYKMTSPRWGVPDVIKVVEIDTENTITAHIEGDDKGTFPIKITPDDISANEYKFEIYKVGSDSEISKTARKNFSAKQQQDFVNENPEGLARNFDKVNLEGTHYTEAKDDQFYLLVDRDDLEDFFI